MEKILTFEYSQQRDLLELHLNKAGAEFLKNVLAKLIDNNNNCDHHFMTPDWGGDELSNEQQNLSDDMKLLHQLKIMYWEDESVDSSKGAIQ
jgi:hypothetical protein